MSVVWITAVKNMPAFKKINFLNIHFNIVIPFKRTFSELSPFLKFSKQISA